MRVSTLTVNGSLVRCEHGFTCMQMVFTLREVLRRKKPEPDTLGLMPSRRLLLCLLLLDDSIPSWKNLAEHIGKYRQTTDLSELYRRKPSFIAYSSYIIQNFKFTNYFTPTGQRTPQQDSLCCLDE